MIPLKDENPTRNFPFFTLLFIVLNIIVFFLWNQFAYSSQRTLR